MDKSGMMGEILEKGQGLAGNVKKQVTDTVKAAASQVAGSTTGTDQVAPGQTPNVDEFVKDLYGIKEQVQPKTPQANSDKQVEMPDSEQAQDPKKIEEQQKLAKLRQDLHRETYYDPLVNPPKEKPEEEERAAVKVEKEDEMEKLEEKEKERKKPPPLAVTKSQQRVEKHPGASG